MEKTTSKSNVVVLNQNNQTQIERRVDFVLENERALARALKKAQIANPGLDVTEFTRTFAEEQITRRLMVDARNARDVDNRKKCAFYVAWAYAWAKMIGKDISKEVSLFYLRSVKGIDSEIQALIDKVLTQINDLVDARFDFSQMSEEAVALIQEGKEFSQFFERAQADVFVAYAPELIKLISRAEFAKDERARVFGLMTLANWRRICCEAIEDGWVNPAGNDFTKKVILMNSEANLPVAVVSTSTDALNQAKELIQVARVHAEEFLIVGTKPYLDKMHARIKEAKVLLKTINVNPKTLLSDSVHKFLDAAEECANRKDSEKMNRIFYLVRGLGGTIGIKDQVEKRIGGIKNRAKKAAEKTQASPAAPAAPIASAKTVQPEPVVSEVASGQLVKC